ncbi:hypothetical protein LCGC14_1763050 [marine sediment metagenome]|uniref:Uncharacterized protein n=1 Tax=marine sediment metagenome TaxID=412755 RepID=A0A0F9H0F4_9ZZZZ
MVKLENETQIYDGIYRGLCQTISAHGVIHRELIDSATKRVLGEIKNLLYNNKVYLIKRVRNGRGRYKEIKTG